MEKKGTIYQFSLPDQAQDAEINDIESKIPSEASESNKLADKAYVPLALSELSDDSTHRLVTDVEKATWGGKADKAAVVNHEASDTSFALTPNVLHVWGEMASLTLTLASGTSGLINEYMFQFDSGDTPTVLSMPETIKWTSTLTPEANKTYQVSILNNIGVWVAV